jgi:outer membrane protein TolC
MRRALGIACLFASLPAAAAKYTLAELIAKASREAPGVVSQRESVAAAQANLRAAYFQWMPSGELALNLGGTPSVECLDRLESPTSTGPGQTVPYADQKLREANCVRTTAVDLRTTPLEDLLPTKGIFVGINVTLNQPLYSFGKFEAIIASARANVELQEASVLREQADVVWNVTRAYWGLKATRAAIAVLDEAIGKVHEWVDRIAKEIGGENPSHYSQSDLARLKVALSNANMLLIDQKRTQFYAQEALRVLTDDADADVDDEDLALDDAKLELTEWQSKTPHLKPEMRVLDAQVKAGRATRNQRIAELLPDLALNSQLVYGYAPAVDSPQNWFLARTNTFNFSFMLSLRQPLDFGVRGARLSQAKHDALAAIYRQKAGAMAAAADVAKAFADWEEAKGRAKETRRGEKISRGWYNTVDQNLAAGLASDGRELVEAAQNYFAFRLRQFQAIFDANVQLAQLRRSSGIVSTR